MSKDLIQAQPLSISRWLPDETLFSYASRFHWISGNAHSDQSCRQLFGHRRNGSAHDFGARVDEFVLRTDSVLGSAEEIIRQRTLLPFYFPFRNQSDADNAIAASRSGGLSFIKGKLGMLASRFGSAHPLKSCPKCTEEDQELHSVSYWHRDHQWPGCWVCLRHDCELRVARAKVNLAGRFHWFLPNHVKFAPASAVAATNQATASMARRLAECSVALGNMPVNFYFQPHRLQGTYRTRLRSAGLASENGRINTSKFSSALESVCLPLAGLQGMEGLAGKEASLARQFSRLLYAPRGAAHPIKHLVLVTLLFESWNDFLTAYSAHSGEMDSGPPGRSGQTSNHVRSEVDWAPRLKLEEAVRGGESVTAAASTLGISVATAMAWLASAGIPTPRRPKKLTNDRRLWAINRLKRGASKESVACVLDMSIVTVTLILRSEPGLQSAWHSARFQKAQRVARKSWTRTAGRLAAPTAKALRQLQPAIFAWLYWNDRAWLQAFGAASFVKVPGSNNAGVRWDERDRALAHAIQAAALTISSETPKARLKLSHLCDRVPWLKQRLSNLDRLPLTRAAISDVIRRPW